ncbi:MAG: hypothetical protein NC389_16170, partial [Acetatifactor muris]|nr:hypothetical protein [Acetatifactor muris]
YLRIKEDKLGGVLVKEVLFVGFKGKNNTSQQLVSLLPTTHKKMLTNSFSGLYKDIERIQTEKYAGVVLVYREVSNYFSRTLKGEC